MNPSAACGDSSPFRGVHTMRHASPERGGGREADEGGLGERKASRSCPQSTRGGQRPPNNPQGSLRIRRIRELEFMVPEFVNGTGGSKWVQAQPAGSRWVQAQPALQARIAPVRSPCICFAGAFRVTSPAFLSLSTGSRQRRPSIRKEACGFGEFGNSNLWFPNSSIEPAAASGCRLSLPG